MTDSHTASETPVLRMRGIRKTFPGTVALSSVDLDVHAGEVHCILGENGAGKSTLMKILAGSYVPDSGTIEIGGELVEFHRPLDGIKAGIAVIYQELDLFGDLTVAQNLFLGHTPNTAGVVHRGARRREATSYLDRVGATFSPDARVADLPIADQQLTAIARALTTDARIIVMDEPTATLGEADVENVHRVIRRLIAEGRAVIYISHRLDEIRAVGTRITVLRDGVNAAKYTVSSTDATRWIADMIGDKKSELTEHRERREIGDEVALEIDHVLIPSLLDVRAISVRTGEIVGLAGLGGAGRTTLLSAVFGARSAQMALRAFGRPVRNRTVRDAVRNKFGLVPESRKSQGLLLNLSVARNAGLAALRGAPGFFPRERENRRTAPILTQLAVKYAGPHQEIRLLSGGNQQKVVLAKWLARDTRILLLDEPTRGLDIGAKADLYRQVRELADRGAAVLVASSELGELMANADRIVVLHEGRNVGEFDPLTDTEEHISHTIISGKAA
ncbi:monosaccharide ABC transporter ATP-binding protein (CUT2 family) [Microbacterium sp. AG1240]|uniref:sugar ABC transporter ATP-binding protein n=1 Tax=Microbacterium sp. AG1240 TaxID=2183992 RepID=UPI000EB45803|nr:sugar ABC transporter ATP-binding protein [Microbacterium sp. AG1240]RKT35674.1 monosaccharide ABC transporter ATP-binding protein (CUT2 family) [Microbacterium sp. AG1240]